MNPRTRSRTPASIGSNQASPANGSMLPPGVVVLSCSMAWSPPALERRTGSLLRTGDYAATRFHHLHDGTQAHELILCWQEQREPERDENGRIIPSEAAWRAREERACQRPFSRS